MSIRFAFWSIVLSISPTSTTSLAMALQVTERVSVDSAEDEGNSSSFAAAVSKDGRPWRPHPSRRAWAIASRSSHGEERPEGELCSRWSISTDFPSFFPSLRVSSIPRVYGRWAPSFRRNSRTYR